VAPSGPSGRRHGKFDVFANITLVISRRHAGRIFDQIAHGGGASAEEAAIHYLADEG
jgi:hypothetical protein